MCVKSLFFFFLSRDWRQHPAQLPLISLSLSLSQWSRQSRAAAARQPFFCVIRKSEFVSGQDSGCDPNPRRSPPPSPTTDLFIRTRVVASQTQGNPSENDAHKSDADDWQIFSLLERCFLETNLILLEDLFSMVPHLQGTRMCGLSSGIWVALCSAVVIYSLFFVFLN